MLPYKCAPFLGSLLEGLLSYFAVEQLEWQKRYCRQTIKGLRSPVIQKTTQRQRHEPEREGEGGRSACYVSDPGSE